MDEDCVIDLIYSQSKDNIDQVIQELSSFYNLPIINDFPDSTIYHLLNSYQSISSFFKFYKLIPMFRIGSRIAVASYKPISFYVKDYLEFIFQSSIDLYLTKSSNIQDYLQTISIPKNMNRYDYDSFIFLLFHLFKLSDKNIKKSELNHLINQFFKILLGNCVDKKAKNLLIKINNDQIDIYFNSNKKAPFHLPSKLTPILKDYFNVFLPENTLINKEINFTISSYKKNYAISFL